MLCCSRAGTSTDFLIVIGSLAFISRLVELVFLHLLFAVDIIYAGRLFCFFCFCFVLFFCNGVIFSWAALAYITDSGLVYAAQLANWRWPQMTWNKTLCSVWLLPSHVTANGATFCHRICVSPPTTPPHTSSIQPLIAPSPLLFHSTVFPIPSYYSLSFEYSSLSSRQSGECDCRRGCFSFQVINPNALHTTETHDCVVFFPSPPRLALC